jgi:ABC-type transport system involved in multi-copper enzyme maturation permease subunit
MTTTALVARQHMRALVRQRTFVLMLSVLLLMTALSGFIGWSSHATIIRVYDETVRTLTQAGKTPPPNPFAAKPRLALLNNMIIYVPLIGALLGLLIGHIGVMHDRVAGVSRLIFSRPVARGSYLKGKLLASSAAVGLTMGACLALSVIALTLINGGPPTGAEFLRLIAFFVLSGLYMFLFVLIGLAAALMTGSQSLALLGAVAVWVVVTFAVPQFTSGLRPVASLNPVNSPVVTTQSTFFKVTSKAKPASVSEQYKILGSKVLTPGSGLSAGGTIGPLLPLLLAIGLMSGLSVRLVRRHDFSEDAARD